MPLASCACGAFCTQKKDLKRFYARHGANCEKLRRQALSKKLAQSTKCIDEAEGIPLWPELFPTGVARARHEWVKPPRKFCYLCASYQPEGHLDHGPAESWNTCKHCGQRIFYSAPDTYWFHVLGPDKLGPLDCAGGHAIPQDNRPKYAQAPSVFDCCDEPEEK